MGMPSGATRGTIERRHAHQIGETMATSLHSSQQTSRSGGRARNLVLVGTTDPETPGAGPAIRVLVAHGDGLARAGLGALLDAEPDVDVAGSAADGAQAVALADE